MISSFEFSGHVVGIIIKTNMDGKAFTEVREVIARKIVEHGKIHLFMEIEKGCNISMDAIIKHLKFTMSNAENFAKIAVVTERESFKKILVLKDMLLKAEVESFSHEERLEAMNWIAE